MMMPVVKLMLTCRLEPRADRYTSIVDESNYGGVHVPTDLLFVTVGSLVTYTTLTCNREYFVSPYSETYIKTTLGTNKMWSLYSGGLYVQGQ